MIAGEEEAAYAWVAVNFVDGALLEATDSPFGTATPSRARGSMEMGGSSAQMLLQAGTGHPCWAL